MPSRFASPSPKVDDSTPQDNSSVYLVSFASAVPEDEGAGAEPVSVKPRRGRHARRRVPPTLVFFLGFLGGAAGASGAWLLWGGVG